MAIMEHSAGLFPSKEKAEQAATAERKKPGVVSAKVEPVKGHYNPHMFTVYVEKDTRHDNAVKVDAIAARVDSITSRMDALQARGDTDWDKRPGGYNVSRKGKTNDINYSKGERPDYVLRGAFKEQVEKLIGRTLDLNHYGQMETQQYIVTKV